MNPIFKNRKLLSFAGILLYLAGTLSILAFSVGVLLGEIEVNIVFPKISDGTLKVSCPLVLSPRESGTIRTTVTNTVDENTKPMVISHISKGDGSQDANQILPLAPGQSQSLEWEVGPANIIYDRVILVNILQMRYSKLDSNQGGCGIMILDLFGLPGAWSLAIVLALCLLLVASGSVLWLHDHSTRDEDSVKVIQIGRVFAGLVLAGLFFSFIRWWGLILLFDVIALIALITAFTDIAAPPGQRN